MKSIEKIQRVSFFVRVIFQILFVGLPLLTIFAWMTSPDSFVLFNGMINMSFIPRSYEHNILHVLTAQDKFIGFSISLLPLLLELYILYSLIQLFKLYEQGEIFSLSNVQYIRKIGYALLLTQVVNPIYEALMGIALTMNNPHGHRFAAASLDQTNLGILFAAVIVILISWIMAEGCKLREDQQLTI